MTEEAEKKEAEEKDPSTKVVEDPPKDSEGLLLHYDAILCGTGIVQSILASALTRAGKTVLHCDGNDHYGELDTVWTLPYLKELFKKQQSKEKEKAETGEIGTAEKGTMIPLSPLGSNQSLQFHSMGSQTIFPITEIGTKVQTAYGEGMVTNKTLPTAETDGRLAIALNHWPKVNGKSPTISLGVTLQDLDPNQSPKVAMEGYFQSLLHIHSQRTLQAQAILQHQSRQLALDVTPSLLYASGRGVQGMLTANVAEHLEFQTMHGMYWLDGESQLQRVPCSKGDVMQSSLLPPLDKRRFMKFFQTAMDYATERELVTVQQEETTDDNNNMTEEGVLSLNERQLNQGRSLARPQNKALSKKDLETLYTCMEQNMDFDSYLKDNAKLSPQLRQLIRHALALEITENSANSLSTQDGMGRLCDHLKALGRYGTTAFLTPLYGSGELSQFFCRSAAVYGATYLLRRVPLHITLTDNNKVQGVTIDGDDGNPFGPPVPEKHIKASHVVVAQDALAMQAAPKRRVLRRISVLRGTLIPDESRSVLILPPTANHPYVIHGLVLDETARVAPPGCSVLHLTTVVDQVDDNKDVLEPALEVLLESAPESPDEIFHTTFSYALGDKPDTSVEGLHTIQRSAMPLVVDDAFEQAKNIFTQICGPDEEFLALSEAMQTKLKEQLKDAYRGPNQSEDDTEQVVLDSAMEMLETKA